MEKTGLQILAEIRETLSALNGKIAQIEFQLEELEGFMCYGELDKMASEIAPEPVHKPVVMPEPGFVAEPDPGIAQDPVNEPGPEQIPESVAVPESVVEPEPVIVTEPEQVPGSEPGLEPEVTHDFVMEEPEATLEPEAAFEPEVVSEAEAVSEAETASGPVPGSVAVPEPAAEPDFVFEQESVTVTEPEPEQVIDLPAIDVSDVIDDLPGDFIDIPDVIIADAASPVESINDAVSSKVQSSVLDMMSVECAWKKDRPGTPVKNIISGISLNDRLLFIKTLFKEDAELFRHTIEEFNSYSALAQAEDYIKSNLSWWKMDSDTVYRFMMAVRRKLSK